MTSGTSLLGYDFLSSFLNSSMNLVFLFIFLIALSKVFIKAGVQWWYAFIPVVNIFCLFKLARVSLLWLLLPVAPLLALTTFVVVSHSGWGTIIVGFALFVTSLVLGFIAMLRVSVAVAKKFGHSGWFGVGLSVLPWLFYSVLAFNSSEYQQEDRIEELNNVATDPSVPEAKT